jgi:hypothetical protein
MTNKLESERRVEERARVEKQASVANELWSKTKLGPQTSVKSKNELGVEKRASG